MRELIEEIKFITKSHINALIIALSCLVLWMVVFHEAISSAVRVWWVSEIYSHGFFILPITAYLIWCKRYDLAQNSIKPSYLALIPLIFSALIYILGVAGDISLFQHAAIFSILPLTIWLIFGTATAKVILFPLSFILFSIPFGEEFIPLLQKITADISVWMLRLIDIPVYRNGLYLEIPNGKFVVAEACSGVRFFVGSAVFGAIYAYVSYRSRTKQYIFFGIALIVPIIANSIRVSAIILIGYFSDMKYATGVDHLVYGWIFFAIVIILLVIIGNIWVDKITKREEKHIVKKGYASWSFSNAVLSLAITLGLYLTLFVWSSVIDSKKQNYMKIAANTGTEIQKIQDEYWKPKYEGASKTVYAEYRVSNDQIIDYYSAYYYYNTPKTELISSANRIYDPDNWTLKSSNQFDIKLATGENVDALLYSLVGSNQEYRLILFWYEVGSFRTSRKALVKLYQSYDALFTKPGSGRIVIYSLKYSEENYKKSIENLFEFVKNHKIPYQT